MNCPHCPPTWKRRRWSRGPVPGATVCFVKVEEEDDRSQVRV